MKNSNGWKWTVLKQEGYATENGRAVVDGDTKFDRQFKSERSGTKSYGHLQKTSQFYL